MSKRAVILAGGKGTRLHPYTVVLPKPLMPIGEYPILEVIVRQLVKSGFVHITMAVNHQADIIRAFFKNGEKWGVKIDYSMEDRPLGTIAPLHSISDLPKSFLVMNGDILSDLDYSQFYNDHVNNSALYSISAVERSHIVDYGVLETSREGVLTAFKEKPEIKHTVSMGVYMIDHSVLKLVPKNIAFGFDQLMHTMLGGKHRVDVRLFSGYWLDIGRPDDYMKAINEFEEKKDLFLKYD
jgi:NDP-mannose synthase